MKGVLYECFFSASIRLRLAQSLFGSIFRTRQRFLNTRRKKNAAELRSCSSVQKSSTPRCWQTAWITTRTRHLQRCPFVYISSRMIQYSTLEGLDQHSTTYKMSKNGLRIMSTKILTITILQMLVPFRTSGRRQPSKVSLDTFFICIQLPLLAFDATIFASRLRHDSPSFKGQSADRSRKMQ